LSESRGREPTTEPHGLSVAEGKRLNEAAHFVERRSGSIFVTIGIEADCRELGDKIKNHVVALQRRHDCPAYWLEVLEPSPRLHSHLIVAAPKGHMRALIESLRASSVFGSEVNAKRVSDMAGLTNYLSKFATPQAAWKRDFRRVTGSHRMEGDRVRLSRELARLRGFGCA